MRSPNETPGRLGSGGGALVVLALADVVLARGQLVLLPGVVGAAVLVLGPPPLLLLLSDVAPSSSITSDLRMPGAAGVADVVEAATLATGQLVLRTDAALAPACRSSSHTMESTHRRRPLVVIYSSERTS